MYSILKQYSIFKRRSLTVFKKKNRSNKYHIQCTSLHIPSAVFEAVLSSLYNYRILKLWSHHARLWLEGKARIGFVEAYLDVEEWVHLAEASSEASTLAPNSLQNRLKMSLKWYDIKRSNLREACRGNHRVDHDIVWFAYYYAKKRNDSHLHFHYHSNPPPHPTKSRSRSKAAQKEV